MLVRALRVLLGLSFQLHVQIHIAAARLVVDGELVDADCEMAVEKQRHTISDAAAILFSMLNFPSGGDSLGKRSSEGKESGKALNARTRVLSAKRSKCQ
jgi:hypothetical protein